jgi:cation transport ATPase
MSRRGRKRARAEQLRAAAPAREAESRKPKGESRKPEAEPAARSRSELRNEAARAKLVPLEEGERPTAVTVAAALALLLALANLVLAAAGYKIQGHKTAWPGVIVFTVLLLFMAWGLWRARYWAVLGMEALLAITMLVFALALPFASNLRAVILSVGVLIPATALFWFLIKAMARIQMPERR